MACSTRLRGPNGRAKSRQMDEFSRIDRLIELLGANTRGRNILLGPGDDAALIAPPVGRVLVSSIDTLVAGVHFPVGAPAELVGCRSMGVSLSDLAAMGAEPGYVLIALTLPDDAGADDWLDRFARGVGDYASRYDAKIAGGNLARGPLNVTVSVHGHVEPNQALMRIGAQPGDLVCVSHLLGGAAAALSRTDLNSPPDRETLYASAPGQSLYPLRRYYLPEPRIELGVALRSVASAAIDISDGLVADLAHLCRASGVAAEIDLDTVPVVAGVDARLAATGGDDYELCFTIAPGNRLRLRELPQQITVIGEIVAGTGVSVRSGGKSVLLQRGGFDHFG